MVSGFRSANINPVNELSSASPLRCIRRYIVYFPRFKRSGGYQRKDTQAIVSRFYVYLNFQYVSHNLISFFPHTITSAYYRTAICLFPFLCCVV